MLPIQGFKGLSLHKFQVHNKPNFMKNRSKIKCFTVDFAVKSASFAIHCLLADSEHWNMVTMQIHSIDIQQWIMRYSQDGRDLLILILYHAKL